jgi:hypothetical protein
LPAPLRIETAPPDDRGTACSIRLATDPPCSEAILRAVYFTTSTAIPVKKLDVAFRIRIEKM